MSWNYTAKEQDETDASYCCSWRSRRTLAGDAQPAPAPAEIKSIAERAYNFAYPLVLMELTRKSFLEVDTENELTNIPAFPDFKYHRVVRPNADTLYTIAWMDLTRQLLAAARCRIQRSRYYLMQFLDAWTEDRSPHRASEPPGRRRDGWRSPVRTGADRCRRAH